MTVVIHGPQGCGKGIHAPLMARHFGCEQIIDDWNGTDPVPAGALVLTNLEAFDAPQGAVVIPFAEAMKQAGLRPFALLPDECHPALLASGALNLRQIAFSVMEARRASALPPAQCRESLRRSLARFASRLAMRGRAVPTRLAHAQKAAPARPQVRPDWGAS